MTPLLLLLAQVPAVIQAEVTIYPDKPLAKMGLLGMGMGVAVWDAHMTDAAIPKLVRDAGYKVLRYPGGSYADIYHWKTHTTTKGIGGTVQPGTDFDSFMKMCLKGGATPLITVNYGTNPLGTGGAEPSEAAEWVRYSRSKGYGVKYWEIGNEVYGNGFYNGRGWEEDLHAPASSVRLKNLSLGPVAYGTHVNEFAQAMKAEDPSVKVGAVMTTPAGWPDGIDPDWNTNVLRTCGSSIDFVVVHWYGEGKSVEETLASTSQIPGVMTKLKALVAQYCRPGTQIWMTEGDGSGLGMRHAGALFAADFFATWLSHGCDSVVWWNLHNGLNVDSQGVFGDQGTLSSGHTNRGVSQPAANTPFPPYYGHLLFSKFARPGDTFLTAASSRRGLVVHAVKRPGGSVAILLINQDPDAEMRVTIKGVELKEANRLDYARQGLRRERKAELPLDIPEQSITLLKPSIN